MKKPKPFDLHFDSRTAKKIRNKKLRNNITNAQRQADYEEITRNLEAAHMYLIDAVNASLKAVDVDLRESGADKIVEIMATVPHLHANDMFLFARQVAQACKDWRENQS